MSRLEEDKSLQTRYESLKQENHQLHSQMHELEEKLQDLSDRNKELKMAAKHKVQDLQREHELEIQVHKWYYFVCARVANFFKCYHLPS